MSSLLGPLKQVAYVVRDIEQAMAGWIALGVGPWFLMEQLVPIEFRYRGGPSTPPRFSLAVANCGDMQIELIQQHDAAPSLYLDTLAQSGECAQHVAFWTAHRFAEICRELLAQGFVEGHAGSMATDRGPFAYFVHPKIPSLMIEITDTSGKDGFHRQVRQAAVGWDGCDPVRRVGPPR